MKKNKDYLLLIKKSKVIDYICPKLWKLRTAGFTQTVLGNQITNNPFTVENITRTWNIIYPDRQIQRIQPTDLYIRFEPVNLAQVKLLVSSNSFEVFDYPLDYEIVHLGEYYDQPGNNEIHYYYAMIPAGTSLPQVPYTLLEELYYNLNDPFLIVESFYATGNIGQASKYIPVLGPKMPPLPPIGPRIVLPPKPEEPCPDGCEWVIVVDDSGPNRYKWECDCSGDNEDPNGGYNPYTKSDCGCTVLNNPKKPGGCINVQTNDGTTPTYEGVRDVKVIIRNYLLQYIFSPYVTSTDKNGCWIYDKEFNSKIDITVRFKNEDSRERGFNFGSILSAHEETFTSFGNPLNNISINFLHWEGNDGDLRHMSWGAASVNNAMQEFLDGTSDINRPPPDLDIFLWPFDDSGAAMMGTSWPGSGLGAVPDVKVGLLIWDIDDLKGMSYHEIAHASHCTKVGLEWWSILMAQEIANAGVFEFSFAGDPHGTGSELFAGHVALAESWADKVAADLNSDNQEDIVFENDYIPTGLYLDLEDDTPHETVRNGIIDRVQGYNRATLFNSFKPNVDKPQPNRGKLYL